MEQVIEASQEEAPQVRKQEALIGFELPNFDMPDFSFGFETGLTDNSASLL